MDQSFAGLEVSAVPMSSGQREVSLEKVKGELGLKPAWGLGAGCRTKGWTMRGLVSPVKDLEGGWALCKSCTCVNRGRDGGGPGSCWSRVTWASWGVHMSDTQTTVKQGFDKVGANVIGKTSP